MRMGPTVKVLFKQPALPSGPADIVEPDPDRLAVLKPEEIPAAFLCAEERNHTTDDRDPFQRWEE
jgi:hypothetical protein